jgi:L-threonylcarbamoyladenylate synthase
MVEFAFTTPQPGSGVLRLRDLAAIVGTLTSGGLAVLPTETGYMLAALATSETALQRAFAVKGRDPSLVMHVACSSIDMIEAVGVLSPAAARLIGEFTPGPLTVVVDKTPLLPDFLVTLNGTVGLRVPDHPATLQVIAAVGAPLTATSLNRSGGEVVPVDETGLRRLNWPDAVVPVVLDPAARRYEQASALVRVTGPSPEILRPGPVSAEEIHAALA